MAGFNILNIVGDPWDDAESAYGGISLAITETASRADSKFFEVVLNGAPSYTIMRSGEFFFSHPNGTARGGMALIGPSGETALTSQVDQNTGRGAEVVRFGWENPNSVGSDPDSVAVLHGMGNNRLSIESNGAIVHIARSGRYEFETTLAGLPISFVGYRAASADGIPFLFNNHGQNVYAESVVQVGVDSPAHVAMEFGTYDGNLFTANAYVDGAGGVYGRTVNATGPTGTYRGVSTRVTGEGGWRSFMGADKQDNGFIGFGTGDAPLDALIFRAGPNLFSIGGAASASRPAIKGFGTAIQGRLADDSDFCTVQGKLTTAQTAVSETITPNSTLTLYDANGTAYKVPCRAA